MSQSKTLLPDKLKYNGDLEPFKKVRDLRFQLFVNAISATTDLKHAALELGVSHQTVLTFCSRNQIRLERQRIMRGYFQSLGKKVKYKYRPNYEKIVQSTKA